MAATAAEIRSKALRKLGVIGLGEAEDGGLISDMDEAYSEVYANLSEIGLAVWAFASSVPDEYVPFVVALCAKERVDDYGVSAERYQKIMAQANSAEMNIRRLVNGSYISRITPSAYY